MVLLIPPLSPSLSVLDGCKYRFTDWGECDQSTGLQTRTGTLKRAQNKAKCDQSISYSKPCPKLRRKPGKTDKFTAECSSEAIIDVMSWQHIDGVSTA